MVKALQIYYFWQGSATPWVDLAGDRALHTSRYAAKFFGGEWGVGSGEWGVGPELWTVGEDTSDNSGLPNREVLGALRAITAKMELCNFNASQGENKRRNSR